MDQPRWRQNIARYVHCDGVEVPRSSLPIKRCDGIAMVWYLSEESRLRHAGERESAAIMKHDEKETFAGPVSQVAMLGEETVHRPMQLARFKLFLRFEPAPGQSREAFRLIWSADGVRRILDALDAAKVCRGYARTVSRAGAAEAAIPNPICDGVDEIATDEIDETERAVLQGLAAAGIEPSRVAATWTTETLLYDR